MTNLEHDRAFKDDQHESRKQTVVPVFIQAPQGDTEDLKHEEGRNGMLRKELGKLWNRDVARVGSKLGGQVRNGNVGRQRNLGGSLDGQESGRVLEDGERRTGVAGIRQRRELQSVG